MQTWFWLQHELPTPRYGMNGLLAPALLTCRTFRGSNRLCAPTAIYLIAISSRYYLTIVISIERLLMRRFQLEIAIVFRIMRHSYPPERIRCLATIVLPRKASTHNTGSAFLVELKLLLCKNSISWLEGCWCDSVDFFLRKKKLQRVRSLQGKLSIIVFYGIV